MLKSILSKTELKSNDSLKTAFIKGCVEGALEGLVFVGLIHTIANIVSNKE